MRIYINEELQNDNLPDYEQVGLAAFKTCAYPSQVDEIYAPKILNFITLGNINEFINTVRNLLRTGGVATLGGIDCYILSKLTLRRVLTERDYNNLLFSDPKFKAVHSLEGFKSLVQARGFKVLSIYVQDDEARFTIEIEKI